MLFAVCGYGADVGDALSGQVFTEDQGGYVSEVQFDRKVAFPVRARAPSAIPAVDQSCYILQSVAIAFCDGNEPSDST